MVVLGFSVWTPGVHAQPPSVKVEMRNVLEAYRKLQPFALRRDAFLDPKNEVEIGDLLSKLSNSFHGAESLNSRFTADPGFVTTLKIANEMLDDARNRFAEGKKGYALWRIRTASNYCVTCHTRFEIKADLSEANSAPPGMNAFEQGEFYLASRQLSNAKTAFLAATQDPALGLVRGEALRKWLVLYVRVSPDPTAAIEALSKVLAGTLLQKSEREEVEGWIESLKRWQASLRNQKGKAPALTEAEGLIRQGLRDGDALSGRKGSVELLRATALLHKALEEGSIKEVDRSRALYSLGLAYSELPLFFVNELPELFLEQAIRDFPNTNEARRSFLLYQQIVSLGYMGSGGMRLPDDVQLTMRELHDLAYGVPRPEERA
jgi:hypothetical protein